MRQIQAAYYEVNGPANEVIKRGSVAIPDMDEHAILVRILASGVNPSDVKTRAGLRGKMITPFIIPHSDGAGIVEEIGRRVTRFKPGDRVWVYNAAWERPYGTAAEYTMLPEALIEPLPEQLSFEQGACLGIPALTAASCLLCLSKLQGKTIVVTGGAGGVGNIAIQLAKHNGATVITTVSSEKKSLIAKQVGADAVINYRNSDVAEEMKRLTRGEGVDLIVDVDFGANLSWTIAALKTGGHIASYASGSLPRPELPFYEMMFKGISLYTILVYRLSDETRRQAITMVDRAMRDNALHPLIGAVFPLENIVQAHEAVEQQSTIGQVIVSVQSKNI